MHMIIFSDEDLGVVLNHLGRGSYTDVAKTIEKITSQVREQQKQAMMNAVAPPAPPTPPKE